MTFSLDQAKGAVAMVTVAFAFGMYLASYEARIVTLEASITRIEREVVRVRESFYRDVFRYNRSKKSS